MRYGSRSQKIGAYRLVRVAEIEAIERRPAKACATREWGDSRHGFEGILRLFWLRVQDCFASRAMNEYELKLRRRRRLSNDGYVGHVLDNK